MASNRVMQFVLILLIATCALVPAANAQIIIRLPSIQATSISVGDFNYDGNPDLAAVSPCGSYLANCAQGYVTFYQGDGAGNFVYADAVFLKATVNGPAAAADFFRNGNLVLVVPMLHKGLALVSVHEFSWYELGGAAPTAVQFADVDHDGKLDMLLSNGSLDVYRGNGAGNYVQIGSYPGADGNLLLGDFNGDGKIDVVATVSSGLNVFLGNGDGTFRPTVHTDGPFTSIAAADFNRDGKLDLIAGTMESPFVTVLLGKGDGTFAPQPSSNTGQYESAAVVVGDFNKDGNPDVAVADGCWLPGWPCRTDGAVTILLGNGDGTLQLPSSYNTGGQVLLGRWADHKMFVTAGDLDRNGATDLVVMNQFPHDPHKSCGRPSDCHATLGILLGNGDGTFQSAPVNNHFESSTSLSSIPNPSIYGQAVNFMAAVTAAGSIAPTGTVSYRGARTFGKGTIVEGVATFTDKKILAGSTNIIATYAGDNSQLGSKSAPYLQTVNQAPTTTAVNSSSNPSQRGQTVTITAAVTSQFAHPEGTVTFTSSDGELGTMILSGGKARFEIATLPVGSTTIMATYNPGLKSDGDSNFLTSLGSVVQVVQ